MLQNSAAGKGDSQPPKNSRLATSEVTIMCEYSAIKNMANFMLLYSVWKPATSSVSASGRSKGARLVSATPLMKKQRKATNCGKMNQRGTTPLQCPDWASTISSSDSVPASSKTPMTESVRAIS